MKIKKKGSGSAGRNNMTEEQEELLIKFVSQWAYDPEAPHEEDVVLQVMLVLGEYIEKGDVRLIERDGEIRWSVPYDENEATGRELTELERNLIRRSIYLSVIEAATRGHNIGRVVGLHIAVQQLIEQDIMKITDRDGKIIWALTDRWREMDRLKGDAEIRNN